MTYRDLIDFADVPLIVTNGWHKALNEGWRWVTNLKHKPEIEDLNVVRDYQTAHGPHCVTIGNAFNEAQMKPIPSITKIGLYVRDADDLVSNLRRGLDRYGC